MYNIYDVNTIIILIKIFFNDTHTQYQHNNLILIF